MDLVSLEGLELHGICFWWGDTLDVERVRATRESMYHGINFRATLRVSLKMMLESRFSNQDCLLFRHCSERTVIVETGRPSHGLIFVFFCCLFRSVRLVCVCVLLWDDVQMRCTLRNWRVKPWARSWIWLWTTWLPSKRSLRLLLILILSSYICIVHLSKGFLSVFLHVTVNQMLFVQSDLTELCLQLKFCVCLCDL